jgi:hypothetical protein
MGKYHYTVDLLFGWFGIRCMPTDNFCFYLQNRLFKTGQTGGQQYSDTSHLQNSLTRLLKNNSWHEIGCNGCVRGTCISK